jgi:hypothetical protein
MKHFDFGKSSLVHRKRIRRVDCYFLLACLAQLFGKLFIKGGMGGTGMEYLREMRLKEVFFCV